ASLHLELAHQAEVRSKTRRGHDVIDFDHASFALAAKRDGEARAIRVHCFHGNAGAVIDRIHQSIRFRTKAVAFGKWITGDTKAGLLPGLANGPGNRAAAGCARIAYHGCRRVAAADDEQPPSAVRSK